MSIKVMTKVWEEFPGGGGSELLAMLALADWSDDFGRCYPGIAAIAKKIRLSRSQTQRVIHGLIDAGFLIVEGNAMGGPPKATRRYRIDLHRLCSLTGSADATGSVNATGSADTQEGSHGRAARGRMDATRTVIDTSMNRQQAGDKSPVSSKAADPCPYQQILDAYHEAMPENPRCKVLSKPRQAAIKARWTEASKLDCKPFGYRNRDDGIAAWRGFFEVCAESDFLTGKAPSWNGRPPFIADIDFIMSPSGFAKILENKYHRDVGAGAAGGQDAIFRGCI